MFCWVCADDAVEMEVDSVAICMEDRLRSLGLLSEADDITSKSTQSSTTLKGINLEAFTPQKKVCLLLLLSILVAYVAFRHYVN